MSRTTTRRRKVFHPQEHSTGANPGTKEGSRVYFQARCRTFSHDILDCHHRPRLATTGRGDGPWRTRSSAPGLQRLRADRPVRTGRTDVKPALSTIVAVDVNIGSDPTKESPADVTLRVRDSSISGAVLAFATRRLGPFGSSGGWVHFELPYTLFVSPGQTYVIELLSTNDTHYWRALSPGTYPNGNAIQSGQDVSNLDFTFRTYGRETKAIKGDVDCNGEVNAVDALKVLRHAAGLPVTQAQPCIGIGQPTDYRTVFVGF